MEIHIIYGLSWNIQIDLNFKTSDLSILHFVTLFNGIDCLTYRHPGVIKN